MKRSVRAAAAVALALLASNAPQARAADKPESQQAQLEKSRQAWLTLRDKHKGDYSYKVRWSSWVGFGHETVIVVRGSKVAERRYREWTGGPQEPVAPGAPAPKPEGTSWTEKGDEVGKQKKGAPPKTLDELYEESDKILQKKLAPHERLYLKFDKKGLLNSCFYVNTMIADDAPMTGVSISDIKLGATE